MSGIQEKKKLEFVRRAKAPIGIEKKNKCGICNTVLSQRGLSVHIRYHNIKIKEYYDKFIKNSKEGICNNPKALPEFVNKAEETKLIKYGTRYPQKLQEVKEKIIKTCLERYGVENPSQSLEVRIKLSGPNHHNWNGNSFDRYCEQWNDKDYKEAILQRDNYLCQSEYCKSSNAGDLVIHHIDYIKLNCHPKNLITICRSCNIRANYNKDFWKEYYSNLMRERFWRNRRGRWIVK